MLISKTLCARARTKAVVLFTVVNCDNKSLARDEGQLSSGKLSFSSCFRVIIVRSTKGHVTCLAVKARQSFWPIFARRKGSSCPAPSGAANQGATCHGVSFRRDGVSSAGTPLKTPWHGLLRALVQEWTKMNCTVTSANNFSGQ
jgi:hypothetical protein